MPEAIDTPREGKVRQFEHVFTVIEAEDQSGVPVRTCENELPLVSHRLGRGRFLNFRRGTNEQEKMISMAIAMST